MSDPHVEILHRLEDLELAAKRGVDIVARLEKLEKKVDFLCDKWKKGGKIEPWKTTMKTDYGQPQKEEALKPCPFCGSEDLNVDPGRAEDRDVCCGRCSGVNRFDRWNQRVEKPEPLQAEWCPKCNLMTWKGAYCACNTK
jgi:hypothetical protein